MLSDCRQPLERGIYLSTPPADNESMTPNDPIPHTRAIRYSRRERLIFRLTGRWPEAVVNRRLAALAMDESLNRGIVLSAVPADNESMIANPTGGSK